MYYIILYYITLYNICISHVQYHVKIWKYSIFRWSCLEPLEKHLKCVPFLKGRVDRIIKKLVVEARQIGICDVCGNTLWLFNIAMENGLFIDGLPIKNGDFPTIPKVAQNNSLIMVVNAETGAVGIKADTLEDSDRVPMVAYKYPMRCTIYKLHLLSISWSIHG